MDLLDTVAAEIKTGWELCGSRWGNCEAETIALQTIAACALNRKKHGETFSWQGTGTRCISGGGLVDNPKGMASLISDKCIVVEPYTGEASLPKDVVRNDRGQPMVIRVTDRLLQYAAEKMGLDEAKVIR